MKVRVVKRTENHLELEVEGEDHTLCNLLKKALLKDENVVFAGYKIDHPLLSNPRIYVTTNQGVSPEDVLKAATEYLKNIFNELKDSLFKALNEFKSPGG
ncbi:MAG: DNA-directed RNA polymerase subunit L [Candidatus Freyarchaeota archaeon]|nr:DNA-directed RNA polymerase subunit L [Candidatus Jordarchaeia archaeon]